MTDTGRTVDITPDFVYTDAVTRLGNFIGGLRARAYKEDSDAQVGEFVQLNLYDAVDAMKEILTQDIELQIANKTFPLPRRIG